MVFSSTVFLFIFMPIVFILNILLPQKFRNAFLLAASLFFYAWGEPVFVLLMLLSIGCNYLFALKISKIQSEAGSKYLLVFSIAFNLLLLIIFKYAKFIFDNISAVTGFLIEVPEIPLPIGISFFTFQGMSFVIDVYRNRGLMHHNNLMNTALYISFFPQLIAGPVVKYHDIAGQILKRSVTVEKAASGIRRFAVGLGKKLLLANSFGRIADMVFSADTAALSGIEAWIGAAAYTIQIYFDFSGYSDMAIGLGRMFGFEIKENFNYPFIAGSIKDFWRRWHISLTNWFREYLYFPLGGNRKGLKRTCLNIFAVFLFTGIWHGAEWTFVLWGIFHGFFMIIETCGVITPHKFKLKFLGSLYTLLVVVVGFAIFRCANVQQAWAFIKVMFTMPGAGIINGYLSAEVFSPIMLVTAAAAFAASLPVLSLIRNRASINTRTSSLMNAIGYISALALLVLCILALSSSTYNPFIYFRF